MAYSAMGCHALLTISRTCLQVPAPAGRRAPARPRPHSTAAAGPCSRWGPVLTTSAAWEQCSSQRGHSSSHPTCSGIFPARRPAALAACRKDCSGRAEHSPAHGGAGQAAAGQEGQGDKSEPCGGQGSCAGDASGGGIQAGRCALVVLQRSEIVLSKYASPLCRGS